MQALPPYPFRSSKKGGKFPAFVRSLQNTPEEIDDLVEELRLILQTLNEVEEQRPRNTRLPFTVLEVLYSCRETSTPMLGLLDEAKSAIVKGDAGLNPSLPMYKHLWYMSKAKRCKDQINALMPRMHSALTMLSDVDSRYRSYVPLLLL